MADPSRSEVLVEFTRRGAYLRCAVVHVATGLEASAMGPHNVNPIPIDFDLNAIARLSKLSL